MRHGPALVLALLILSLPCAAAWGQSADHPLAKHSAMGLSIPGLSRLEWGPTSLSYSQAWSSAGSQSQGFLLKELRGQLAPSLTFQAQMGVAFTPGGGLSSQGEPARFALPFAALTWRPSESTIFRLEYSQRSAYGFDPWYGGSQPWYRSLGAEGDLDRLDAPREDAPTGADE